MENKKLVPTHTKKRKKIVMLPDLRSYVYQPNRITNAIYDYSLIQERIFNSVMFHLQEAITISRRGEDYTQLSLFKDYSRTDSLSIKIPLRDISTPQNYEYVKNAIEQLAGIVVSIPYVDQQTKKSFKHISGLLKANIPETGDRSSTIEIIIDKHVAKMFIEIDKNPNGQPINYTRFIYEIAQRASNKYTSRIYKLICSWKKKGGFTITLDEFRKWIGIEDKYKQYNEIKKRILMPVQKELFEHADCWFNCESEDFTTKQGNIVTHLNFKVISPELIEEEGKRKDYVLYLLKTHFQMEQKHLDQIQPILDQANLQAVMLKITQLREYYLDNVSKITDIASFVVKSLLNEFQEEAK